MMNLKTDRFLKFKEEEFNRFVPKILDLIGNHKCIITDYDKDGKTFWLLVDFGINDSVKSLGSIHLQFGKDSLIVADASIENMPPRVDLDKLYDNIMKKIRNYWVIQASTWCDVYLDYLDVDFLVYSLQIEAREDDRLPKLADIDEVMTEIKNTILNYELE